MRQKAIRIGDVDEDDLESEVSDFPTRRAKGKNKNLNDSINNEVAMESLAKILKNIGANNQSITMDTLRSNKQNVEEWFDTYERMTNCEDWDDERKGKSFQVS